MTLFVMYAELRWPQRDTFSAVCSRNDWMKNMGVSSVAGYTSNDDSFNRPPRELFQSLEVYLLRSGYEAIVAETIDYPQPDRSAAEMAED